MSHISKEFAKKTKISNEFSFYTKRFLGTASKSSFQEKKQISQQKVKKISDLNPKIVDLLKDTGTNISNYEDLVALSEISVQELIDLFEEIARGVSKKQALLNITASLVQKRRERIRNERNLKIEFDKKLIYLKKCEIFIEDKLYIQEQLTQTNRKAFKVLSSKIRILKSTKQKDDEDAVGKKDTTKQLLDRLKAIQESGEACRIDLKSVLESANQVVRERAPKSIERVRKREARDRLKFDKNYGKFYAQMKGYEEHVGREVFFLGKILMKELQDIERLIVEEENEINEIIRREHKVVTYSTKMAAFDKEYNYANQLAFYLGEQKKRLKNLHYVIQNQLKGKPKLEKKKYVKKLFESNMQLIEDEIREIDGLSKLLRRYRTKLNNFRKNEVVVLNLNDERRELQLNKIQGEIRAELDQVKIDLELQLGKLDKIEEKIQKRTIVIKYYLKKFDNYNNFLQKKLGIFKREMEKKRSSLKEIREAEGGVEIVQTEKISYISNEIDLSQSLLNKTSQFERKMEEMQKETMDVWERNQEKLAKIERALEKAKQKRRRKQKLAVLRENRNLWKIRNLRRKKMGKKEIPTPTPAKIVTDSVFDAKKKGTDPSSTEPPPKPTSEKAAVPSEKYLKPPVFPRKPCYKKSELELPPEEVEKSGISIIEEEDEDERMMYYVEDEGDEEEEEESTKNEKMQEEYEKLSSEIFSQLREKTSQTEKHFGDLLDTYKSSYEEHSLKIKDKIDRLEIAPEEKTKRKSELERQNKTFFEMEFYISQIEKKIELDLQEKKKLLNDISEELLNPETSGGGTVVMSEELKKDYIAKKEAVEKEVLGIIDLSKEAAQFGFMLSDLKSVSNLMCLMEERRGFVQLKKEKGRKFDEFRKISQSFNENLQDYARREKISVQKKAEFDHKIRKFEEYERAFEKKKREIGTDMAEIDVILESFNELLQEKKLFTPQEEVAIASKRENLQKEKGDSKQLDEKIINYEQKLGELEQQAFQIYVVDSPEHLEKLKEKERTDFSQFSTIVDSFDDMIKDFESKTRQRRQRRREKREKTKALGEREQDINEKELESKLKLVAQINEKMFHSEEEVEKQYFFEKREALIEQIKSFSRDDGNLELLARANKVYNLGEISHYIDKQARLKARIERSIKDVDNIIKKGLPPSETDLKMELFKAEILKKKEELEDLVRQKQKEIDNINSAMDDGDNFSDKDKALLRIKKQSYERQIGMYSDLLNSIDEIAFQIDDIKEKMEIDEPERSKMYQDMLERYRDMDKNLKEEVVQQETVVEEKQKEFLGRKEEEFEEDALHDVGIDQFKDEKQYDTLKLLNKQYTIMKFDPKKRLLSRKKRLYEIDFFNGKVKNMTRKGKIKKTMNPSDMLCVERYVNNLRGLRLLFLSARHSYELIFESNRDREELISLVAAIRPYVYSWAPSLVKDKSTRSITTLKGKYSKPLHYKDKYKKHDPRNEPFIGGEFQIKATKKPYEELLVWTCTWNLGKEYPSQSLFAKEIPLDKNYDLYCVCMQESPFRKVGEIKKYFDEALHMKHDKTDLSAPAPKFTIVKIASIYRIQIVLIAKISETAKISNVQSAVVSFKKARSKGTVAITIYFNETSMVFLGSHFPEDKPNVSRDDLREQSYEASVSGINLGYKQLDIWSQFDYCFWLGDFSYRVKNFDSREYLSKNEKNFLSDEILKHDQLTKEKAEGKIFVDFVEPKISFRPTYPVNLNNINEYEKIEKTSPSYPNRIFYKTGESSLQALEYKLNENVVVSNYFPVVSLFKLETRLPFNILFEKIGKRSRIRFLSLKLVDNKKKISKPKAFFYCNFINEYGNSTFPKAKNTLSPEWEEKELPCLFPNVYNQVLRFKTIIIAIRDGTKETENFSNLVCTGRLMLTDAVDLMGKEEDFKFSVKVYSRGKITGELKGSLKVEQYEQKM